MDVLKSIDFLIKKEVGRAVTRVLESRMDPDQDERSRQDRLSKEIDARKLRSEKDDEKVEEAESEELEDSGDEEAKKPREDRTGGKSTADSSKIATPSSEKFKDPSPKTFIDKLNILRGGKSLKDPEVRKSLEHYLDSLSVKEKQTMLVFVTAVAQILAGVKTGAEALDPSEVGINIKSQTSDSEKPSSSPSKKSDDGSSPIVVGESQDKSRVKKIIEAYRKNSG